MSNKPIGALLAAVVFMLTACGGGGGGAGGGSEPAPSVTYATVQPPAAPPPEAADTSRASGVVAVGGDTWDAAGRKAGITVALHAIQADGSLGPVRATTTTAADGSFALAMPAGTNTVDGGWMLMATSGGLQLRAYLHAGAVRVDASSDAWVRMVVATTGRLTVFTGSAVATLKDIVAALALYSDATGDQRSGLDPLLAADAIQQSLAQDHATRYVQDTLRNTGSLPTAGVGDVGAFFAQADGYAAFVTNGRGDRALLTLRGAYGVTMAADGSWSYRATPYQQANGQWTPVDGRASDGRLTPSRGYERMAPASPSQIQIGGVVGEYPSQSFPVRPGARQLDARRFTTTGLNFTGGTDEQPLAFGFTETAGAVETVTLAAGSFRAVRLTTEMTLVLPKTSATVTRLVERSTRWLVPGVGIVKELGQTLIDGAADPSSPDEALQLQSAYANGAVWPSRVTMTPARTSDPFSTCPAIVMPALRRFVTTEHGELASGTPRMALALWDMDTGARVGAARQFSGNQTYCLAAAGDGRSVLVPEAFSERNLLTIWPADAATATAQSDVIHHVSGADLSELATYRLPAVPEPNAPGLYRPAALASLYPAPDGSTRFLAGTVISTYTGALGFAPQHVQVFGPGLASARADVGATLVIGADWASGRLYTTLNVEPYPLRLVPFTAATGADVAASRLVRTGLFANNLWHAGSQLLYLNDGRTIRVADGSDGPRLPYATVECATRAGQLFCLDHLGDRLVRLNADTLELQASADLGSFLRRFSNPAAPNFGELYGTMPLTIVDESSFIVAGVELRVGRWR